MKKLQYNGICRPDGTIKVHDRAKMEFEVSMLFAGREITVIVQDKKKSMSNKQHGYYRGCMLPEVHSGMIAIGWRISINQTHEYLGKKFMLKEEINEETGEIITFVQSMADMSTIEFMETKEAIQQWGAEYLSIKIPDPLQQIKADL